jgi:hypothetical protein
MAHPECTVWVSISQFFALAGSRRTGLNDNYLLILLVFDMDTKYALFGWWSIGSFNSRSVNCLLSVRAHETMTVFPPRELKNLRSRVLQEHVN